MSVSIRISGADHAAGTVRRIRLDLSRKCRELLERLAAIGIDTAAARFSAAQYDGVNDVFVSGPEWIGENRLRIHADGSAVAFIEFGTGVHYSEIHPKAGEFGAVRGGYGLHLGLNDSWRYRGDPGTNGEIITFGRHAGQVLTHGNPPARAMYETGKEIRARISAVAAEVFG